MALSNSMASVAAVSQLPTCIRRPRCHSSSTPLTSAANLVPPHPVLSAAKPAAHTASNGCSNIMKAAAAAGKNENNAGMERLQEEDMMELRFGRMLGESPDVTLKKVLTRKSNPSLNYIDIEKSTKRHDIKPTWPFSTVDVSEVGAKEHMQIKASKLSRKDDLPELLRPLSRSNTNFTESQAPSQVNATPKNGTRGYDLDLTPKPVPIKQKSFGLPPLLPELKVIPPVMIKRKQDQAVAKQQSTEPGLSFQPPTANWSSLDNVRKNKHLHDADEHGTSAVYSYLLRRPLAPLSDHKESQTLSHTSHQQHGEYSDSQPVTAFLEESSEKHCTEQHGEGSSLSHLKHENASSIHSNSYPDILTSTSESIDSAKQRSGSSISYTASSSTAEKDLIADKLDLDSSVTYKFQSVQLKSLSSGARKPPVLSSKPSASNPLSFAKCKTSVQGLWNPGEETTGYSVEVSHSHLKNNNVKYPTQSTSENVHSESSPNCKSDERRSRFAEEDALQSERTISEESKANGQIQKPAEELTEEACLEADTTADEVAHVGGFSKEYEPTNTPEKVTLLDGMFEMPLKRPSEKKNLFLEEQMSSPTKSDVYLNASYVSRQVEQILPSQSLNRMLRKPTFDLSHRKKSDMLMDKQALDCVEGNKGDLDSKNKVGSLSESKHNSWETFSVSKQQESRIPPSAKGYANAGYLPIREPYPTVVASVDPLPQNRPNHEQSLKNATPASPADENEDRDWARAEVLRCTRAVVEVKLITSNSGGMLASLGLLVGFLPAKELGSNRGLSSFAVWAREKGYSIQQGQMKEDTKQTSNELGIDYGSSKLEVNVVMPNEKLIQGRESRYSYMDQGDLPSHDGKKSLESLQRMYRKEKAERLASLVGEKAKVVVTFVDRSTRRLLVSERKACNESSDLVKKKVDLMGKLKVGDVVTCTIRSFASFGVFVDLQGVPAFIHQSELSWNSKVEPSSILHIDQEIQAVVADLNCNLRRINLSVKRMQMDPLFETLESLSVAESNFTPDVLDSLTIEAKGAEVPELEALYRRLEESKEIIQVVKGRCITSKTFAPNFQVYLSTHLESGYKLLARYGNVVQEVFVKTELDKENVKNIISSSALYDSL